MNVLPVLVGLSQSKPFDTSTQGVGSSVGEFARLLDRTLSGTTMSGGMQDGASPSSPYVSPTAGPPDNRRSSSASNQQETRQGEYGSSMGSSDSVRVRGDASDRSARPQHAESHDRASPKGDPPQKRDPAAPAGGEKSHTDKVQSDAAKAQSDTAASDARSASAKGNGVAGTKSDKKKSHSTNSTLIPGFPGAFILAGGGKNLKRAIATAVRNAARELTGSHENAAKDAAQSTSGKSGKSEKADHQSNAASSVEAAVKDLKKTGKQPKVGRTVQVELAAAGSNTPSSQAPGAANAVNTGPGLSNIQQHPANAHSTGNSGAENQNAAVTIIDLRHPGGNNNSSSNQSANQGQSNDGGNFRLFQLADGGASGTSRMNGQAGMVRTGGAPATGQSFSALTDQIVKQTGILLKNNNSGEIRLVLKPEKLGSIRIRIDMNNQNLTGRILVQNHQALKLVQQNLDSLYQALRDSGFTATALNVSVGGREGSEGKDRGRSSPLPSMRAIAGVKGFENQAPALESAGNSYSLVNLVI